MNGITGKNTQNYRVRWIFGAYFCTMRAVGLAVILQVLTSASSLSNSCCSSRTRNIPFPCSQTQPARSIFDGDSDHIAFKQGLKYSHQYIFDYH